MVVLDLILQRSNLTSKPIIFVCYYYVSELRMKFNDFPIKLIFIYFFVKTGGANALCNEVSDTPPPPITKLLTGFGINIPNLYLDSVK